MAVRPPGKDELAAIARGYGMHLSDEDLGSFEPMVAGLLSSYDAVEELYNQTAPQPPAGRTWKQPDPGGEPAGRLVRPDRDRRTAGRAAGRAPGRDQGQHRGRRRADDERLAHPGGLRAQPGRDRGDPAARGRGDDHRQVGVRGPVLLGREPHVGDRPGPEPVGYGPNDRRLVVRKRGPGRLGRSRPGDGRGPGRFGAHSQFVVRHGGAQADPRPGAVHRGVPDRVHHRPSRADHPHRGRCRADAERDRGPGRLGSPAARRPAAGGLRRGPEPGRQRAAGRRGDRGVRHPGPVRGAGGPDRPGRRGPAARGGPERSRTSASPGTGTRCTSGT